MIAKLIGPLPTDVRFLTLNFAPDELRLVLAPLPLLLVAEDDAHARLGPLGCNVYRRVSGHAAVYRWVGTTGAALPPVDRPTWKEPR